MKKTMQIERNLQVPAGQSRMFSFTLRESYQRCTGFFLTPKSVSMDFTGVTFGLNIGQQEVLPMGCDASLFATSDYISRMDAVYDFTAEGVAARSSDVQFTVNNGSSKTVDFNAYFILEN